MGGREGGGQWRRREEEDHNEGMRVCRAVKRCLLDSQRHARWVNGRRGTEMDSARRRMQLCMYLRWNCARLCVHCVHEH